ncbi:MAG: ribose 5-phosphate isomerase B [Firmicutes bacterium]|nr:ribose 5-phosphate isomerase B [Bacillota bacterium]
MKKTIVLASDHGGFELKEGLKIYLAELGFKVKDAGTKSDKMVDYPVFIKKGVEQIIGKDNVGIFICGAGIGASIMANRHKGIRAALCHSVEYAQLARQHNDANVLCLGGRFLPIDDAKQIVNVFLGTPYLGGRYDDRNKMLDL